MRKRWIGLGLLVVLAGGGWTAYWQAAAGIFRHSLDTIVANWRSAGYEVRYVADDVSGFPWSLRIGLSELEVRPHYPAAPWSVATLDGGLTVVAEPWNAFGFAVELTGPRHALEVSDGAIVRRHHVQSDTGTIAFGFTADGQVDNIAIEARNLSLDSPAFGRYRIGRVTGTLATAGADSGTFSLLLTDADLPPSAQVPLGRRLHRLAVDGRWMGKLPPIRLADALTRWRDAGGTVELLDVAADWGPLAITANGTLALDDELQPNYDGTATVRGYDAAVEAAASGGFVAADQVDSIKLMLAAIAKPDSGGSKVTLPTTIRDGWVSLGPLKVAAVPRLIWW